MRTRTLLIVLVAFCSLLGIGCEDPEQKADEYFRTQGLNRIRRPNDYMAPGSVLLVKKGSKTGVYADNILDYIDEKPSTEYSILSGNEVLPMATDQSGMKIEAALKFLDSMLPVKLSGNIHFTSEFKIEQTQAKISRIIVDQLKRFLSREHSKSFRDQMMMYMSKDISVYIAYQTYRANKLTLSATTNNDIAAEANVGVVNPILENGTPKFSWTKKSSTSLVIDGDSFYVFAVKTAKLTYDKASKQWSIDITNWAPGGGLAAGTDDKYNYAPTGSNSKDFAPIEVIRQPMALIQ